MLGRSKLKASPVLFVQSQTNRLDIRLIQPRGSDHGCQTLVLKGWCPETLRCVSLSMFPKEEKLSLAHLFKIRLYVLLSRGTYTSAACTSVLKDKTLKNLMQSRSQRKDSIDCWENSLNFYTIIHVSTIKTTGKYYVRVICWLTPLSRSLHTPLALYGIS